MKSKKNFLTLEILRENKACEDRYLYLVEKLGADWKDDQPLTLSKILEVAGVADCLWAFKCFDLPLANDLKRIAVKTAIFAAKKVLPFWTDVFPDDDRPAKAIEAAEAYLANPTVVAAADVVIAAEKATEAAEAVRELVAAHAAYAIAFAAYSSVFPVYSVYTANYVVYTENTIYISEVKRHLKELLAELSL